MKGEGVFREAPSLRDHRSHREWYSRLPMAALDVGLDFEPDDKVELLVSDLSLARALYEGVPAARLLARLRLGMDERDARATSPDFASARNSFETLVAHLTGASRPAADRVQRAVARHAKLAAGEGSLTAPEPTHAALVFAVAVSEDVDASLAEVFTDATEPRINLAASREIGDYARGVAGACAVYDERLGKHDPRAAMFEACVRLACNASLGPLPQHRLLEAARVLYRSELATPLLRLAIQTLLPRAIEAETPREKRRMARLDRAELDALLTRDLREIAAIVARVDRGGKRATDSPLRLDSLIADLSALLSHDGTLVLAVWPGETEVKIPSAPPPSFRPSWAPAEWATGDVEALAAALERGTATLPGVAIVIARGGDAALDAIGSEMLSVPAHPFASAAFAEVLAASTRPRDVIRLVTYFAIAPDPSVAARTLSMCQAPELPSVLKAWLEAMLPSDGAPVRFAADSHTSAGGRLTACIASLKPYPNLYSAVSSLLNRVSDAPPMP